MRYDLNQQGYENAIERALEYIGERSGYIGAEGLAALLANVWDPTAPANVVEILSTLDLPHQELAIDLLVGRMRYGRPISHPRADEIENVWTNVNGSNSHL